MRYFSFLSVLMVCVAVFSANVQAASCYNSKEAEAELGVRILCELMEIGLNCQHMTPRGWKNFYVQYQDITRRHKSLISSYEKTLISYFKRNGGNAEKKLHNMRTDFANQTSTNVARMRPDVFCATYSPRIPKAANMGTAEFKDWAASTATAQRLSKPLCN